MRVTPEMIKKVRMFTDQINNTFLGENTVSPAAQKDAIDNIFIAIFILQDIIVEAIEKGKDPWWAKIRIQNELSASNLDAEVIKEIDLEKRYKEALIRSDFGSALAKTDDGRNLSHFLRFSFRDKDIQSLAEIHKTKPDLKQKIEKLLTDCNFHTECTDFCAGHYDKYLAGTI